MQRTGMITVLVCSIFAFVVAKCPRKADLPLPGQPVMTIVAPCVACPRAWALPMISAWSSTCWLSRSRPTKMGDQSRSVSCAKCWEAFQVGLVRCHGGFCLRSASKRDDRVHMFGEGPHFSRLGHLNR